MLHRLVSPALAFLLLSTPHLAHAEMPEPVRAMIDAAIAGGDPQKVATIIELARATNPAEAEALDAIEAEFTQKQARLAAEKAEATREAIRTAGALRNWSGRGELGAFRSTGNSSNTGVSAGLKLERKGIDWRHKLNALVDYQRSNGQTTREQYLMAYEPNIRISPRAFVYGLAQFERDRFQGYLARYSVSGGAGYRLIDDDDMKLSVKGGPAWRRSELIGGETAHNLALLAAGEFNYRISQNISLTQDASAYFEEGNGTYTSATGLEAGLGSDLKARLSYTVEYDSNPPGTSTATDTKSRFTLVYGF